MNRGLEKLGQKYSLAVLNLDAYINSAEIYDKGILWIDRAHFDSAGYNYDGAMAFNRT